MSVDFYALWGPEGKESLGEAVNCNGANGNELLRMLGYVPSPDGGDADPDEFLVRVRRAKIRVRNISGADDEQPWTQGRGARGAQWAGGYRREGYFAERLPDLEEVGRQAKQHGGRVCWA